jgi:hypothetical protein
LKVNDSPITVLNNQTFEEALMKNDIVVQTDFVLLPNGRRVNVREGRIRQFIEMNIDDEVEIRWDPKNLEAPKMVLSETPGLEEGWIDFTDEKQHLEPEVIQELPERLKVKKTSVRSDPEQQPQKENEGGTHQENVLVIPSPSQTEPEVEQASQEQPPSPLTIAPPESFWEESDQGENKLGKAWEVPASPKNKKRNHARRDRRMATRRRLAE